jgi:thioredoxin reductase
VEALPQVAGWNVHAAKLRRLGVPIYLSHTILEACGTESVERAVIAGLDENCRAIEASRRELEVDLVCIAVGLRPLVELAELAGCRLDYLAPLGGFLPVHDEGMRTTCPDVYVAGDIAGIEEASTAMEEGKLAGAAAARALGRLEEAAYCARAQEIQARLHELRLGSFGEGRLKCKEQILKRYREVCPPGQSV